MCGFRMRAFSIAYTSFRLSSDPLYAISAVGNVESDRLLFPVQIQAY